eukprot:TRINITY_DN6403_c0_g1_i1.p2 TRINITY_DN6403_c0_g1~~TRINITY_DN6403_c0_g1_i1.p2  ORF type:complete len:136 (-),score=52.78 TRINITY_DN6403_c0_g1_i1:10-417(-)
MCIRDRYKEISQKIRNDAIKAFGSRIAVKSLDSEKTMFAITFGSKCDKCKKDLGTCDQYRCVICNPAQYYCVECIKSFDEAKTTNDLFHPHGMYFIQKNSQNTIDEIKIERMKVCLLYTSPSPRDLSTSRMPSSA